MRVQRRTYELTYILTSVLSSDQTSVVVSKITAAVQSAGGDVKQVDQWGMRRLAYPVAKKRNGYYVNMVFEGPGTMVPRIERLLTIDDHVLRYLTLALDTEMLLSLENRLVRADAAAAAKAAEGEEEQEQAAQPPVVIPHRPRYIDFKDTEFLKRYTNEQGKILPRRFTMVSARRQRAITRAIKRARHLALMPFVADFVR